MGGVLLPGSAQQRPTSGQVVSLGDGRTPSGKTTEFTVSPGDEVCFHAESKERMSVLSDSQSAPVSLRVSTIHTEEHNQVHRIS